jgi:hypothetical protein
MEIQYFDPDADSQAVSQCLLRDGATVVRNQVPNEVVEAVLSELREPFDTVGRCDESEFNGFKTLRSIGHTDATRHCWSIGIGGIAMTP